MDRDWTISGHGLTGQGLDFYLNAPKSSESEIFLWTETIKTSDFKFEARCVLQGILEAVISSVATTAISEAAIIARAGARGGGDNCQVRFGQVVGKRAGFEK